MNWKRMKFLLNRLPMARIRVDRAARQAAWGSESDLRLLETAREGYRALRKELEALREEARPAIEALERPIEREVMTLRYLRGLTVREIAYRVGYSDVHTFRLIAQAEKRISASSTERK